MTLPLSVVIVLFLLAGTSITRFLFLDVPSIYRAIRYGETSRSLLESEISKQKEIEEILRELVNDKTEENRILFKKFLETLSS